MLTFGRAFASATAAERVQDEGWGSAAGHRLALVGLSVSIHLVDRCVNFDRRTRKMLASPPLNAILPPNTKEPRECYKTDDTTSPPSRSRRAIPTRLRIRSRTRF